MISGKDLQNRQTGGRGSEGSPPANGHGPTLAERIAAAKALRPPATRVTCQDCWRMGRDQAIAAIEGAG